MTPAEVERLVVFCAETAHRAGEIHLEYFEHLSADDVGQKGRIDLVTIADTKAETSIGRAIRDAYPDHEIVSEESAPGGPADTVETAGRPRWYVDPLDGTTNFVHGFPVFAVSIACWLDDAPVAACVHAPYLRETFTAGAGLGARLQTWRGERPLAVTETDALSDAVIATGFCYERREIAANNVANFSNFILDVQGIRRAGAAALDLAYVAAGRFDGYWEPYLNAWDIAAGILLVKEAGGVVTDFTGGPATLDGRAIVAAGPRLHPRILQKLVEGPGIS